jgi:hypothetical protein
VTVQTELRAAGQAEQYIGVLAEPSAAGVAKPSVVKLAEPS